LRLLALRRMGHGEMGRRHPAQHLGGGLRARLEQPRLHRLPGVRAVHRQLGRQPAASARARAAVQVPPGEVPPDEQRRDQPANPAELQRHLEVPDTAPVRRFRGCTAAVRCARHGAVANSGNGRAAASERAAALQRISVLPARARLDALIASKDAAALVRAMPPEQLYATVAEVGLADTTELIQLASPAQFQALVDLGAWKRDSLDLHGLLEWIRAARGEDAEDLLKKVHGLDIELLESMLRAFTVVHDLEENPDPVVEGVTLDSADGHYRVELKVEGPEQAALRALLLDLMAEDPLALSRLLEALRWEVPSEMEEAALRFRWARLSDLGFPDPAAAAGLYAAVRLPPPLPASAPGELVRTGARRVDFVQAALEGPEPVEAA